MATATTFSSLQAPVIASPMAKPAPYWRWELCFLPALTSPSGNDQDRRTSKRMPYLVSTLQRTTMTNQSSSYLRSESHSLVTQFCTLLQRLQQRSTGLSTRTTVRHQNTAHCSHSLSSHIIGHWQSRGQCNPLVVKRLLLVARDLRRFILGSLDCTISKSPRHLPSGKLNPLPVPNRPWSHLGVDFITDLPPSDGNTCILVIVDIFSKSCRVLPLKGLPMAMETAELLFNYVFRYYGIPEDIVSDRGPQFTSRVWKAIFSLLGVSISLSSGFHPQSNRQTERKVQEISRFLRTLCHGHQNSWNQFLGWAEYAQNSLCQPSTGFTPFQCRVYSFPVGQSWPNG